MINNFCTITPNRGGERASLLEHCVRQLQRMGCQMNSYIINHPAKSSACDLVPRVKEGIELARRDGFEYVFIVESDDYYPSDYFQHFSPGYDFYGFDTTVYYNIKNRTFSGVDHHRGRASLFCTGFRIAALDTFNWPSDDYVFLDIKLWEYANARRKKIQLLSIPNPCLGIKHGIGKVGGNGHRGQQRNQDRDLSYLKKHVDAESFEFYHNLNLELV